MDEIRVLDSKIFNRIAAGEVVESPKSVVKELIENSIDAGANKISIDVEAGGIELIKVVDNGKGILPEDMKTAFLPHATSKISVMEDLDSIATLGFRGEALPSIASVAEVTMISRKVEKEIGYSIKYIEGSLIDEGEAGCPQGTTVLVENIFKNIPARSKFLKKPTQEESEISDLIVKIILANPLLSIKYSINGQLKYHSSGDGVKSAIFSIYGTDVLENLTLISNVTSYITLNGYISKPSYSKFNRNFQTLIVNGRYVINQDLSYCIGQCYQEFLMKRQFPMYILYLDIPLDMVDVNIQPNKMNVKFVDFPRIKGVIYNTIKDLIEKENRIPKNINNFMATFSPEESSTIQNPKIEDDNKLESLNFEKSSILKENSFNSFSFYDNSNKNDFEESPLKSNDSMVKSNNVNENYLDNASIKNESIDFTNYISKSEHQNSFESFYSSSDYSIIGKLFNTYIIVQKHDNVLLIDQHAAHEKIIYDKLVADVDNSNIAVQDLLVPYNFDVSNYEKNKLLDILNILDSLGFSIKLLEEQKFSIISIPTLLSQLDLKEFVANLMNIVNGETYIKSSEFLKENLMQTACKAAVKGEMDLSNSEIESLLNNMKKNNIALFCPHGRPIVVTLTRFDIEKWFKRIV